MDAWTGLVEAESPYKDSYILVTTLEPCSPVKRQIIKINGITQGKKLYNGVSNKLNAD